MQWGENCVLPHAKCTHWKTLACTICAILKYEENDVGWECDTKHVLNFYHCNIICKPKINNEITSSQHAKAEGRQLCKSKVAK